MSTADDDHAAWLAEATDSDPSETAAELDEGERRRTFIADELLDAGYRDGELLELVVRLTGLDDPQARTLITHEVRRSHEEALQRLAEIAANVKSATVTYLQIGGWPAMQRRYSAPLRRRVEPVQPIERRVGRREMRGEQRRIP